MSIWKYNRCLNLIKSKALTKPPKLINLSIIPMSTNGTYIFPIFLSQNPGKPYKLFSSHIPRLLDGIHQHVMLPVPSQILNPDPPYTQRYPNRQRLVTTSLSSYMDCYIPCEYYESQSRQDDER